MTISLGDALLKLGVDSKDFDKGMEETEKKVKTMTEKIQTGLKIAGTAFTALGATSLKFINDAKDLNALLGQTAMTMGITTDEMRELTLATSNAGLSIDEVQKSFDLLSRAGVTDTAAMKASTEAFDALADATGSSADAIASLMIPTFRAFGQEIPTTTAELDKFTWLTKNTTVDLSDFSTVVQRLAPDMQAAGISMDDAIIALAGLTEKGITGRAAISELNDAVGRAVENHTSLSQELGLTSEQIAKYQTQMNEAAGSTDRYSEVAESNITIMDKLKQGFKEFSLRIGDALSPLEPLLAVMTAMGPIMMTLSTAQGMAAVKTAGHTIALIAQKTAMLAIAVATKAWAAVQWVLNAALTANPIGLIIAAVAALIAIIILLVKNWDKVVAALKKVGEFFVKIWNNIVSFFKKIWENIVKVFKQHWDKILLILFPAAGIIALFVKNWGKISEWFKQLWEKVKKVFEAVWNFLKKLWEKYLENLKKSWDTIVKFFTDIWDKVKQVFTAVWNFLKKMWETYLENLKKVWTTVVNFFTDIWEKVKSVFTAVWNFLKNLWEKQLEALKSVWNTIVSFFSGIWDNVKSVFSSVWDALKGIWDGALDGLKSAWDTVAGFFSGLWNGIKGTATTVWNGIVSFFSGVVDKIKTAWNGLTSFFTNLWNGITNVFKTVINFILGLVEGFVNFFIDGINYIISGLNKIQFQTPEWFPGEPMKWGVNISPVGKVAIPRLAEGGLVTQPTAAMIGEKGPEVVMPLDRLQLGAVITYVVVNVGSEKLADIVDRSLDRRKRIQQVV